MSKSRSAARRLKPAFFLKLAVTLGLFYFLLRDVNYAHLGALLARQSPALLLAALMLQFAQIVFGGYRWQRIVNGLQGEGSHPVDLRTTQRINYIGSFFLTCLPGAVGSDVMRAALLRQAGWPAALAVHSVVIDRMVALAGLGLFMLAGFPWLSRLIGPQFLPVIYVLAVLGLAGLLVLTVGFRMLSGSSHPVLVWLREALLSARRLAARPRLLVIATLLAVLAHLSFALQAVALLESLHQPAPLGWMIILMPFVSLLHMLPISIGGWGVREAGMIGLLAMLGISHELALAVSVQMGALMIVASLPAGLLWALRRG